MGTESIDHKGGTSSHPRQEVGATRGNATDGVPGHQFLLFVRGANPSSNAAIHQFRHFCADRFGPGEWILEIVDLQDAPEAGREHQILATPAVVMQSAGTTRKIVGDLRSESSIAQGLKLA